MKMNGEERIAAPINAVWAALNDPDVLRHSIPGCQSLEPDGENAFKAGATIKVGPVSARFGGVVRLFDLDPPRGYRLVGEGSGGAAGAAKGGANVRLVADGDHTVLHYEVDAEVSGRLAQLGGKLIDITARQLAGVFFSRFSQEVIRRQAEAGAPVAAPSAPAVERAVAPAVAARPEATGVPVALLDRAGFPASACLLLMLAALTGGFILGRTAEGWGGAGALAGAAVGLLIVLVAAAAFLLGLRPASPSATVRLDDDTIERLAAAVARQQR